MTPDELQELDSWLAEHVMEWTKDSDGWWGSEADRTQYPPEDCEDWLAWRPSSNPEQALQVAEKIANNRYLEDDGIEWPTSFQLWRTEDDCWKARFDTYFLEPEDPGYADSGAATPVDSLPLAICLAAKAWKTGQA